MDVKLIISKLQDYFEKRDDISMVFIFGSLAADHAGIDSDIDIAIYFKPEDNVIDWENLDFYNKHEQTIWLDIERIVERDIDLLVLNRAVPTIAEAALRGIPVVIKNHNIYLDFCLKVTSEAIDFRQWVEDYWKDKEKIKNAVIT